MTEGRFSYWLELRRRLLRAAVVIAAVFVVAACFANHLYQFCALPLLHSLLLPQGDLAMIATDVSAPLWVPLQCAWLVTLLVVAPYLLYELWGFVAPALYRHERRWVVAVLGSSSVLFYLGVLFAYSVVLPLIFRFMASSVPVGVHYQPDITAYLSFISRLFLSFGVAFELPIAVSLLVGLGVMSAQSIAKQRPYVIVALLVIGMLLTPPDVMSQLLLAVPMWGLFELGLLAGYFWQRQRLRTKDAAR